MAYRVVHYINQFFAGIGGEEKADITPEIRQGAHGPGLALHAAFKGEAEIVATFVCGDNYMANNLDAVVQELVEAAVAHKADALVAGPAFNAGRYGTACGAVCDAVSKKLNIPVITAMYTENPGVDLYRTTVPIVATDPSARGMGKAIGSMAAVLLKCLRKQPLGSPAEEGLLEKGIRVNQFYATTGAERAVDMLVKKLKNEPFITEYPMPVFDRVEPRPAVQDMSKAIVALVTSGGIVPAGNPDHIAASSAQNYGAYAIDGVDDLQQGAYSTAHGGFDQTYANLDADRVLPVDVLRDLEKEGRIGKLHNTFYSTVGNGTAVSNSKKFGLEIGEKLRDAGVQAVILTST